MPENNRSEEKNEKLKQRGSLNPHPERVVDAYFLDEAFFDPSDLLQVKYEMLRRVQVEGRAVTRTTADFGFSRRAFYQIQSAFNQGGLTGLLHKKRGPRKRHKLTDTVMDFLKGRILEKGDLPSKGLVEEVSERFGLKVHKRTIERALGDRKKKS